jgi:phosphoribosylformimino-5-aminoimidazole carboxamide ribotide isomerase
MVIIPAIDLKCGECVRLIKGDFATTHIVAANPLDVAADFAASGAEFVHCIDLDGARDGVRANSHIVELLCNTALQVELGGGLRTMRDLEEVAALGVARFVLGSAATDRSFMLEAIEKFGDRIVVGIDSLDGYVRTDGWQTNSGIIDIDFARQLAELGVKSFIFTDISTDGTLSGPPIEKLNELKSLFNSFNSIQLIASGGISGIDDIRKLREIGVYGTIIGKAYYSGAINLKEAIRIAC